jgi:3-dehydroquinate dehydratase-1
LAPNPPKICVALVNDDLDVIKTNSPLADMFEVRIDLIGKRWQRVAACLKKPWIACNRWADEGGKWHGKEAERINELRDALKLGAAIIDVELATPSLVDLTKEIKDRAKCLISYHNIKETPPLEELRQIVNRQLKAGADICKVVTTARAFADNFVVLDLVAAFSPKIQIVAFAMGAQGKLSRILSPLAGGAFTYASAGQGKESAEGQLTVKTLRDIYGMLSEK